MSKACQLYSGSSGNSIFISSKEAKILVDTGVSAKRICEGLSYIGEEAEKISAIFITHEHSDHIKGLRVFAAKYNIPVFADEIVLEKMAMSGDINDKISVFPIQENMELNGIEIVPFRLSHDSTSCHGFRFNLHNNRSVSVCTDTGYVTEEAKSTIKGSDLVFLESNHEITMLQNGYYPYYLKQRILSSKGHLSNTASSEFAKELIESGTTRLVLSHLSKENNHTEIARQTALSALNEIGAKEDIDFRLSVSAPINEGRAIVL